MFHAACVAALQHFGVKQACPLCRKPLPAGPEKLFEEATRIYTVIARRVKRGETSWASLAVAEQRDVDKAVAKWRAAARAGHTEAQYDMGLIHLSGNGVAQDGVEAAYWIGKAAEHGYPAAQCTYAFLFLDGTGGTGVAQSYEVAARWFRKAADQGNADAQEKLGGMFRKGCGVVQSNVEAARWYKLAARQGNSHAQNKLGDMYSNGLGVQQNDVMAVQLFKKAATQGHAKAQYKLGVMFDRGRGVEQSSEEAVRWYKKAGDQGVAEARLAVLGYLERLLA